MNQKQALHVSQHPWLYEPAQMRRARVRLRKIGLAQLAEGLTIWIDEPLKGPALKSGEPVFVRPKKLK